MVLVWDLGTNFIKFLCCCYWTQLKFYSTTTLWWWWKKGAEVVEIEIKPKRYCRVINKKQEKTCYQSKNNLHLILPKLYSLFTIVVVNRNCCWKIDRKNHMGNIFKYFFYDYCSNIIVCLFVWCEMTKMENVVWTTMMMMVMILPKISNQDRKYIK